VDHHVADYECIERRADLEALVRDLLREDVVAFDTEADSFYHYFDKTCLVQVATRRAIFLVDPLALGGPAELAPLGAVFAAPNVQKIFHAAEYDIYVLKRDCGFKFANLFDTMVSAQLLGYPSIGLAALAERHHSVSLPKDEQRSDWSIRPLTPSQLSYAAADVAYLIPLAETLADELAAAGRRAWADEEFEALTRREWPERQFDETGYLKIKGARSMEKTALAVLRELYLLRDARAREIDRPPFKVLGNRVLLEISERQPTTAEELGAIKGVTELILRRLGREVLAAVARGRKRGHGPIPRLEGSGRRRLDRPTERRLGALKRWRARRASELALDPGVLCPNAALEAVAARSPTSDAELTRVSELKPWFVREFGSELVAVLHADGEEPSDDPEARAGGGA
jgi:ribonuclease D